MFIPMFFTVVLSAFFFQLHSTTSAMVALQIVVLKDTGYSDANITHGQIPETGIKTAQQSNVMQTELTSIKKDLKAMADEITKLQQDLKVHQNDSRNYYTETFKDVYTEVIKSPYSNKLFIFPVNEKANFLTSKSFCEERGTTLISIHSELEYKFVENWLTSRFPIYSHFWMGHQRQNLAHVTWNDGTTLDYTSWGPVDNSGQPNPSGCMFMCHYCGAHINGWYIRVCHDQWYFLCQKLLS